MACCGSSRSLITFLAFKEAMAQLLSLTTDDLSETDPLGNTTFLKYDDKLIILEEKDPEGNQVTRSAVF